MEFMSQIKRRIVQKSQCLFNPKTHVCANLAFLMFNKGLVRIVLPLNIFLKQIKNVTHVHIKPNQMFPKNRVFANKTQVKFSI